MTLLTYTRSQPVTALLITTGVGMFVGMLMARGRVFQVADLPPDGHRDPRQLFRAHASALGLSSLTSLEISRARFEVTMNGRPVDWTRKEFG